MNLIRCDVGIVGCGPTGVVLANLLGALGVRVVVIERDAEVYPVPRATHIDEETLRNFQATGLIDKLLPHTAPFGALEVVDASGAVIVRDRVADPASPHGYPGSSFFDQPAFERVLREGLHRYPNVTLLTGVEATSVAASDDSVRIDAHRDGEPIRIQSEWAVGCDGGRSLMREAMGADMAAVAPKRPWIIVDALLRDPADAATLPDGFRYVLADHLTISAHGIGQNRRWEFQLRDDEDVPDRDTAISWMRPYVDPDRLEILRVVPYAHTSLLATSWRNGRMFVAGDAAHMMPPSAGQGMCSGIRDAMNLAWKLHRVISGTSGDELLDTYEQERAPHVREMLLGTLYIGRRLLGDTMLQRWRRRVLLGVMASSPTVREFARRRGVRRPQLREGFFDRASPLAGQFFPQFDSSDDLFGYAFAVVTKATGSASITEWLRRHNVDWVLVRPDRYVHSAGRGEWTGFPEKTD